MAKRKKSKSKKTKTTAKKVKRKKTAKKAPRKSPKKTAARKSTSKAKQTKRSSTAKKRAPRRKEADMSWPEVRASRLRKGQGREDRIVRDFDRAVNMTPQAIEKWLNSSESREVGTPRKSDAKESVGHWSGRRILEIKKKNPLEYEPEDYAHMRKVAAFVARHSAQRPAGDVRDTRWRYSLMNWGHDPLK